MENPRDINIVLSTLSAASVDPIADRVCSELPNSDDDLSTLLNFVFGVLQYCSPGHVLLLLRFVGRLSILNASVRHSFPSIFSHAFEYGSADTRFQIVRMVEDWCRKPPCDQPISSQILEALLRKFRWVGDFSKVSEVEKCIRSLRYLTRSTSPIRDDSTMDELLKHLRLNYEFVDRLNSAIA